MWLEFGYRGKYRWVDILQSIVKTYNDRVHRTIGMKPSKVTKSHEKHLLETVYHNNVKFKRTTDLKEGDYVRVSDVSGVFRRGYQPSYTPAIWQIVKVKATDPITFQLKDEFGKVSPRSWYRKELVPVRHPGVYLVEKVLKADKRRGYFIKWLGYDDRFNEWVKKLP